MDNLPATPLPIVTKALQNPSPVSTFMFKLTSMNGGAAFPRSEGWKVTPQNAGIVHSLTVVDWAFRNHQPLIQTTQNDFGGLTRAVIRAVTAVILMCVGRAILRGSNSRTKTIHQTVVDPGWIIAARSKRQHLIAAAAVSFVLDGA